MIIKRPHEDFSRSEALMHPVRFRIASALLGDRAMGAGELAKSMRDIPQATLYRHIKRLVEAGVLVVERERRVRGATERYYRLDKTASYLPEDEVRSITPAAARRYFGTFVGSLLGDFERYTAKPFSMRADKMRFRKLLLHCNDQEYGAFLDRLDVLVSEFTNLSPRADRRGRFFTNITIPETTT